jgi:hypothetical protein
MMKVFSFQPFFFSLSLCLGRGRFESLSSRLHIETFLDLEREKNQKRAIEKMGSSSSSSSSTTVTSALEAKWKAKIDKIIQNSDYKAGEEVIAKLNRKYLTRPIPLYKIEGLKRMFTSFVSSSRGALEFFGKVLPIASVSTCISTSDIATTDGGSRSSSRGNGCPADNFCILKPSHYALSKAVIEVMVELQSVEMANWLASRGQLYHLLSVHWFAVSEMKLHKGHDYKFLTKLLRSSQALELGQKIDYWAATDQ